MIYTAAISKIKDTVHARRKLLGDGKNRESENTDPDQLKKDVNEQLEKEQQTQQSEKLLRNSEEGDVVFFVGGGDQWYDRALWVTG